jgi:hypothetical protein
LSNWGTREHNAENRSSVLLWLVGVAAASYWLTQWQWLLIVVTVLIAITIIIHTYARIAHGAEKRAWKRVRH